MSSFARTRLSCFARTQKSSFENYTTELNGSVDKSPIKGNAIGNRPDEFPQAG
jgi:hypothetical protein